MAQLWGGRFTKETDQLVYNFNASISFDKRFYKQDIRGSIAHVTMLEKQGILTKEEKDQIIEGLESICRDVENKTLEITEEYAKKYNLHVDPNAKVRDIPVGMKQKVEILKALVRGAKILILDEPTAVLTTQETEELFKELVHLKEQGYTMIFISHKLHEIKQITDRLTIMRSGKSMGVYQTADISKEEISRLMVGRDVILTVEKDQAQPTDVVLRVRDLEYTNEWNKKMLNTEYP